MLFHLKEDLKKLANYRIPPQFFGPAAKHVMKYFKDEQFSQSDYDCVNYIVNLNDNEELIRKREKALEVIDWKAKKDNAIVKDLKKKKSTNLGKRGR